jgi:predicted SprT family Zn-dependent metalloprotease
MAKTKWSVQDIRNLFNELDKITGADSSKVEIKINGRLKRALARYTCYTQSRKPVNFDFGTDIMNVPDFQALKDTAIHEYAHFIVNTVRKSDNLGHSAEFRQVCKDLGTNNYNATCTRFVSNQVKAGRLGFNPEELDNVLNQWEKELEWPKPQSFEEIVKEAKEMEQPKEEVKEEPKQEVKKSTKGRLIGKFDLNGNLLEQGKSSYFKEQGYPMGNVSKCCNGKLKTVKGFTWKYLD